MCGTKGKLGRSARSEEDKTVTTKLRGNTADIGLGKLANNVGTGKTKMTVNFLNRFGNKGTKSSECNNRAESKDNQIFHCRLADGIFRVKYSFSHITTIPCPTDLFKPI